MKTGSAIYEEIYQQSILSDAHCVCGEVNHIIDSMVTKYHITEDQCFDLKVILCELLQNAIRHGNALDRTKQIDLQILMDLEKSMLEITVADEGSGFNVPQTITMRRQKAFEAYDVMDMDEFGRGLLIVKNLCDDVHYNHRGNQVTVKKSLAAT